MHRPTLHVLFVLLSLLLAGCGRPRPALTPTPTPSPSPVPTSTPPEIAAAALQKNSLEFYRNGKTYEVVIGYNLGSAFNRATPRPALPKKYAEVGWGFPTLQGYGDFDRDGETEFYVTVGYCGANCSEELRLYKYDPAQDQYIVAARVSEGKFRLDDYEDFNQDGNPELIIGGMGYCLHGDAGDKLFSTVTVLRYEQGRFADVTLEFPQAIADDAARRLSFSETDAGHQGLGELTLAAYLYDMIRLGKQAEARLNFERVCNAVIQPREAQAGRAFDCPTFLAEVETDIKTYDQKKSQQ